MKINNKYAREVAHWSIFILAALTMTVKIAEVSAYESLKLLVENPECASYSYLVK
jgi:hypothetical protein